MSMSPPPPPPPGQPGPGGIPGQPPVYGAPPAPPYGTTQSPFGQPAAPFSTAAPGKNKTPMVIGAIVAVAAVIGIVVFATRDDGGGSGGGSFASQCTEFNALVTEGKSIRQPTDDTDLKQNRDYLLEVIEVARRQLTVGRSIAERIISEAPRDVAAGAREKRDAAVDAIEYLDELESDIRGARTMGELEEVADGVSMPEVPEAAEVDEWLRDKAPSCEAMVDAN